MQMKKTLAAILSTSMTLSMLSVSAFAAEDKPLMEDAANSWAASSIDRWVQQGIVQGDADGSFKPYRSLTRGELATVFVRMFGLTEKAENRYDDLDGSEKRQRDCAGHSSGGHDHVRPRDGDDTGRLP